MNFETQRLVGAVTSALVAAALVAGAAQARPDDRGGLLGVGSVTSVQTDRPDDRPGLLGVGSTRAAVVEQAAAVRPDDRTGARGPGLTPPVTLSYPADGGGFEWGGAEIATGVAVFMALLAAATLIASHRRERPIRY